MKFIIITLLAICAFWYFIFVIGWGREYSEGERTGEIFKLSRKGLVWKSWEGTMYLGGVRTDGGGNLQLEKFSFSIPASEEREKAPLIEAIKDCASNRKVCTIRYQQWFKSPIEVSTEYIVVGVEERKL